MQRQNQIVPIPIDRLIAHPENPNRMSDATFKKLKAHIAATHNYEPIIVRAHPDIADAFEIINGHHRVKAIAQLGNTFADCVEWDVDDDQTRILLATLNRLSGKDILAEKVSLIKSLSEKYDSKELSKLLPDTAATIERLKDVTAPIENYAKDSNAFLNTMVFFLDDDQMAVVESALERAVDKDSKLSKPKRMAEALVKICG